MSWPWSTITVVPYSGAVPAKTTVPAAGACTAVPRLAPMSMPAWNSGSFVHGDLRLPNSEFTEPRTGQREGSAARALPARPISRSSARRFSPSCMIVSVKRFSSSLAEMPGVGRSDGVVAPHAAIATAAAGLGTERLLDAGVHLTPRAHFLAKVGHAAVEVVDRPALLGDLRGEGR